MPRPIYSQPFFIASGLSGHSEYVVCPDNHVLIVKQLTAYASPLIGTVHVFFQDMQTNAALWSAFFTIDQSGWQGFYGAMVFGPGSGFRFFVDASDPTDGADLYAGGYSLIDSG